MTFHDECASLAPLESFDPSAFQPDSETPERLCNFILALALIYNDCKDIISAVVLLHDSRPDGPSKISRIWGAYYGIEWHLLKIFVSLLHELFNLIRENKDLLEHPLFTEIVRLLRSKARQNWRDLVAVALGATPKSELGRILLLVRNKVSSHYDLKCLAKGYSDYFLGKEQIHDRAYVSRGNSMSESRFYFADAAVQGYLFELIGKKNFDQFMRHSTELFEQLNVSLMSIVDKFIQKRSAYRSIE